MVGWLIIPDLRYAFGTGMVARHCMKLFQHYGIWDRVRCFLDHNRKITEFLVSGKAFPVYGPEELYKKQHEKDILSYIARGIAGVSWNNWNQTVCLQLSSYFISDINEQFIQGTFWKWKREISANCGDIGSSHIPQQIHTCWFGKNKMPYLHQKFIEEWKICNPDYEIILWNESNYDVTNADTLQEAYESENYALYPIM